MKDVMYYELLKPNQSYCWTFNKN